MWQRQPLAGPLLAAITRVSQVKIFYDISPFATRKDLVARPAGKMLVCSFGCLDLNDLIQSLAMWAMHQGKSCVFANHVGGPNTPPPSFSASHLVAGFCCGTFSATQVMGKFNGRCAPSWDLSLIYVKNSENMGIDRPYSEGKLLKALKQCSICLRIAASRTRLCVPLSPSRANHG